MSKPKFTKSLGYAFDGLKCALVNERNFRIHLVISAIVIGISWYLRLESWEWIAITFAIIIVLISELINTAIEKICDFISPDIDPRIKVIKDVSAGFVLIAALGAAVVGVVVFGVRLL